MKNINKGVEPSKFTQWKVQNPAANYDALHLAPDVKNSVKQALIAEQFSLCCYCENEIANNKSSCHIEHLKPRKATPALQLSYTNMLASCEADGHSAHCGHQKKNNSIPIHPLTANSVENFRFAMDGQVLPNPANNQAAIETIKTLRLDNVRLNNFRAAALSVLDSIEPSAVEEIAAWRNLYTQPINGKLPAFCSAMLYQLDQI